MNFPWIETMQYNWDCMDFLCSIMEWLLVFNTGQFRPLVVDNNCLLVIRYIQRVVNNIKYHFAGYQAPQLWPIQRPLVVNNIKYHSKALASRSGWEHRYHSHGGSQGVAVHRRMSRKRGDGPRNCCGVWESGMECRNLMQVSTDVVTWNDEFPYYTQVRFGGCWRNQINCKVIWLLVCAFGYSFAGIAPILVYPSSMTQWSFDVLSRYACVLTGVKCVPKISIGFSWLVESSMSHQWL